MEHKTRTKALSWLLTLTLMLALVPGMRLTAYAADNVPYQEASWNSADKKVEYTTKTTTATEVTASDTAWSTGWYVVNSNITNSNRITVTGEVQLILCDDCTLTASGGIQVSEGNTLKIYAQSGNSGSINAKNETTNPGGAGIGGISSDGQRNAGHIEIHGGSITARSSSANQTAGSGGQGAGIGGGYGGNGGTIDIYGGTVSATGAGWFGAGIGGGGSGSSGTITIYGGNIEANGNNGGAGIGGGKAGKCDSITIHGGVVRAWGGQGGSYSAGIGAGQGQPGGTIVINGGDVLTRGGHGSPGIGAGGTPTAIPDQGTLTIAPGMVVRATIGNSYNNTTAKWPCLDYIEKREQCVRVWSHTHSNITYTASGDTLTGSCTNPDCNYVDGKINVKVEANNAAYDGNPHGVTLSYTGMCHENEAFDLDTEVSATAKVQYQEKIDETTYGTATETVPVEPGTYRASITLGEGEGAATAYVEYTITNPDYNVTVEAAGNGAVTADQTTAKFADVVTLTVTPDKGKDLVSIAATSGTLTKTAEDADTGTLTYTLTGITADTTVTAKFGNWAPYTVLYNAPENPEQVFCYVGTDPIRYQMTKNVGIGGLSCWAFLVEAADDLDEMTVSFSTDGTTWSSPVNAAVQSTVPATLNAGAAVALRGTVEVFALALASDDTISSNGEIEDAALYYLVTADTQSITVPNPERDGYTFNGWAYNAESVSHPPEEDQVDHNQLIAAGSDSTEIPVSGTFTETTILSARWTLSNCQVTYDLNGGSGSASAATVNYGGTINAPANPTKSGNTFVRWVVAEDTVQLINSKESRISAGTAFDFVNTGIINDLKLKAEWKHVHSYVCLPLDHSAFGNAFKEYVDAGYGAYLHIRICTSVDDYIAEAHSFNSNGKCVCGAVKTTPKATLTKIIDSTTSKLTVNQNQITSISAPLFSNNNKFARWEYSGDEQNWRALTTSPYAAFAVPQDMSVRAVYEPEKVTVSVESFMDGDKLVFFFYYSVPNGWKVVDGGLLSGDNQSLRYMELKFGGGRATPYYLACAGNAISKYGAETVGERIFREQAISGSGKPTPDYKRPSVLGQTACCAITYPRSLIANYNGNYYLYGMGFILCEKPDGSRMGYKTNAIWATKNSPDHVINDVWNVN